MATKAKSTNTETLRSVALDVINNYQRTARSLAASMRASSKQGLDLVNSSIGGMLKYESKISKKLKSSVGTAGNKIASAAEVADKKADKLGTKVKSSLASTNARAIKATDKVDKAVDSLLKSAAQKVSNFTPKDERISRILNSKPVTSVEPIGIKGAQLLRFVSAKMADGAESISHKVEGGKKTATATKRSLKKPSAKKPAAKVTVADKKAEKPAPTKAARKAPRAKPKAKPAATTGQADEVQTLFAQA